jgi:hypothetical protein
MNSLHQSLPHRARAALAALILTLAAAVHVHAANTITQVAPADFGSNNAIAIGADGFPVIAHVELDPDGFDDFLYVTKCGNADCTANNTRTFVNGIFAASSPVAIIVPADGLPVISYIDVNEFKVVKCGNSACSTGNIFTTLDDDGSTCSCVSSVATSIALSPQTGLPVIAFVRHVVAQEYPFVVVCQTSSCSSNTKTYLATDAIDFRLSKSSMAMGIDGFPIFSYVGSVNDGHGNSYRALKALKCGNVTCDSGNVTSVIRMPATLTLPPFPQPARLVSTESDHKPSIAIGTDGRPVISFVTYAPLRVGQTFDERTPTALTVARCKNPSCSVTASVSVVDSSSAQVGAANTISVPADGRPVVSYYDSSGKKLKVAKCGSASCISENTVNVVDINVLRHLDFGSDGGFWSSMVVPADGRPIISYSDQNSLTPGVVLKVLRCGDASCTP